MKPFYITVALLAVSVEAGGSPFKGRDIGSKWRAPRETQAVALAPGELAYMAQIDLQQTPVIDTAPATTEPATLSDHHFWERDTTTNTCAYISGNSSDPLYCAATAACAVDTDISIIGCCAGTATQCTIYTTCLPLTSSADFTTNNGLTLFCNDATYPECITHKYVDAQYSDYILFGCANIKASDDVYFQPTTDATSTTTTSTTSSRTTKTASTAPTTSTTSTTAASATQTAAATTDTSPTVTTTAVASTGGDSSKSNVGPIVGGVVGGLGGLALVAAGVFLLLRRSKQKQASASVPLVGGPGAPGSPLGQPPMAQNGYYSGVPGGDFAGAGAAAYHPYGHPGKADGTALYDPYIQYAAQQQPYDPARVSMYTATTMGSPQPTQSPQSTAIGTPQPPMAAYTPPLPAPGMGYHSGPVPATIAELPTERGHGTVQEMA